MHVRFDEDELRLLREAERRHGESLTRSDRPGALRAALDLAKAASKVRSLQPDALVSLDEPELSRLIEATKAVTDEPGARDLVDRLEAMLRRDDGERRA